MPKDRTRRVLHTTAHQRLSFCDASGTTRRDESGTKACGDGYSRQADRSGTPHSSFRESSVSGFEDKHDASSICLGDSAEFQDLLCSDDGRKTVNLKLAGCVALFLVAYCIQPLLVDALKFEGAAATSTCIYLIPHFLGMLSVVFTVNDSSTQRPTHRSEKPRRMPLLRMRELHLNRRTWRKAFFVAGIDLLHQVAEKAGLVLCGSGAYVLVSSSSIVWTAVISACVLRRKFSSLQWMSLMLICGGISMKAADLTFAWQNEEFLGVTITFLSAILQGLTFVVNEKYMTSSRDPSYLLVVDARLVLHLDTSEFPKSCCRPCARARRQSTPHRCDSLRPVLQWRDSLVHSMVHRQASRRGDIGGAERCEDSVRVFAGSRFLLSPPGITVFEPGKNGFSHCLRGRRRPLLRRHVTSTTIASEKLWLYQVFSIIVPPNGKHVGFNIRRARLAG